MPDDQRAVASGLGATLVPIDVPLAADGAAHDVLVIEPQRGSAREHRIADAREFAQRAHAGRELRDVKDSA